MTTLLKMNNRKVNVLKKALISLVMMYFSLGANSQVTENAKSYLPVIKLTGIFTGSANGYYDETAVFFDPACTYTFNLRTDARKLMNTEQTMPNLYTIKDNMEMAINGLPEITDNLVVPLGFDVRIQGMYKIIASEISNIDSQSVQVYLQDLAMNVKQDLVANPEYLFSINPADKGGRFSLLFRLAGSGVHTIESSDFSTIYSSGHTLYLNNNSNAKETLNLTVTDLQGQKIFETKNVTTGNHQYTLNEAPGLYLVNAVSKHNVKTQKVYIY
jgi:hypothetical protein